MATKTISEITINKIRIGGKAPKKIMKGSTEVMKVTKGSTVVYQKENVVYTLTGTGSSVASTSTSITFTIKSYKGSSTGVAITSSNVSVSAGGGTIKSVTGSGTTYTVTLTISANSSTSGKTHTIKVTQPTSGQSINVSGTQSGSGNYLKVTKINVYSGPSWPSWGTSCYLFLNEFFLGGYDIAENFSSLGQGHVMSYTNGSLIESASIAEKPPVYAGSQIKTAFCLGGTIVGNSSYHGTTFKFTMSSNDSLFNSVSSSWVWQIGVQPSPTQTLSSTFKTISTTNTNYTLNITIDLSY